EPGTHVCVDCSTTILAHLRQTEYCLTALSAIPVVGEQQRRAPGFGSRSPARDDVIAATDVRTGLDAQQTAPGAMAALVSWCELVAEERGVRGAERATPEVLCGYLRRHHGWITAQPWVDEYATELRGVRDQVRSLAGLAPEAPQGRCWVITDNADCGGPLWWSDDRDALRCGDCGRVYTGHELMRWQVGQQEAV
ncbi:MAG: hypothetical protein ACRDQA_31005, partial [Nocardioidaceae bacterium]